MEKIAIAPTNFAKVKKAIELVSEACGLLQTSGLQFSTVQSAIMAGLKVIEEIGLIEVKLEVVASGRGRPRREGNGDEHSALTTEEMQRLTDVFGEPSNINEVEKINAGVDVNEYLPGGNG